MLHLADESLGTIFPSEDAAEISDVLALLRDGFHLCHACRRRCDVSVHAAPRPKRRRAQYLRREGGRPADDQIRLHHEDRFHVEMFETRVGDRLVCRTILRTNVFRVRHPHARNDAIAHAEREQRLDRVLPDGDHALRRTLIDLRDGVALFVDVLNRDGRIRCILLLRCTRTTCIFILHLHDGTASREQENEADEQQIENFHPSSYKKGTQDIPRKNSLRLFLFMTERSERIACADHDAAARHG